jgi:steroid delta-isomerase-like uncharacterized protein
MLMRFVNLHALSKFKPTAVAAAVLLAAAFARAQTSPTTSTSENPISHADIQKWADAWNSHNIETVMALFTPDVVINQPANPKPLESAGIRSFFTMIFKAYPDFHVDVTDAIVDDLKGVSVERVTGTWSGPYTDPATGVTTPGNGRKFDHPGAMVLTYRPDHKISRVDIYWDQLTVERQLGIAPK